MYIPKIYALENLEEILEFIKKYSFCTLVNQNHEKIWATHIPLLLEKTNEQLLLHGHISKLNEQGKLFESNPSVLAIFTGPHSYISPSWYDHENVPTWNYTAVHVYGTLTVLSYEETLVSLQKMMNHYESEAQSSIRFENLSKKVQQEAKGVLAFTIAIEDIQAVKKLSQNRDDKNYNHIITKLEQSQNNQAQEIALEMKNNRKL
ncbi:PaiB family negative transcriptional regulator [Flavobacterium croceum DSM 17960]|uniref:PaiB family negative transcriptional regulator n=1 Tax=Flavobacterium croceum DSM 17960 TaxID=1121886 RepID=A0A2S4N6P2_9FLAO|nr:FMN-binding negative transcriptional regulator [Flavobacterium croceum]POS01389.1 PaiB family negative transcriptional regulator [Flavobacterium croceum DSM 17960]